MEQTSELLTWAWSLYLVSEMAGQIAALSRNGPGDRLPRCVRASVAVTRG